MEKWYQPHEFARIVGMTKRALRYYREKQILVPDRVNDEGHTFYSEKNLLEAQQITTLRYLELSVDEIRTLQQKQTDIGSSLELQKNLLKERLLQTTYLIDAIDNIQQAIQQQSEIPWNSMFETVKFVKHATVEESMREYYDERAVEYEKIFTGGGPASCKPEVYEKDVKALFSYISEFGSGNIIDIGCGTGYWLQRYYKNCKQFTFLDVAPQMLKKCNEKVELYGLSKCAQFIRQDFLKWEVKSLHTYDCAVSGFLLGHFMSKQEAAFFEKLREILKPTGKILIIDNTWSEWRAIDEHKEDIEKRTLTDGRVFSIYKKYFEKNEITQILEKNGFKVESICRGLNFFGIIGKVK